MRTITIQDNDFSKALSLLLLPDEQVSGITETVAEIISSIKRDGDKSLVSYTNKFDRNELTTKTLRVSEDEIDKAYVACAPELIQSLELCATRIRAYYEKIMPQDLRYVDDAGVILGARYVPVDAAGIYVPGGKANYPSSVLMNAIPAKVAGVKKVVMVTPAANGEINPVVLAAAKISGIDEIYKVGGAQAIAALAYGTETVPKVDKIVGPGNAYVAEAKRQVFGIVGIDMIAGPSEILVIADDNCNPQWIAADLLSQAEHDELARSILITTSQNFAQKVIASVYETLSILERKDIARYSIENHGLVIVVENLEQAAYLSNIIAPEHLELAVDDPDNLLKAITNAGAVFLGRYTPEAIGDYIAGPSHVLPTVTSARFSSGLGVHDFLKRQSIIGCDRKSFDHLADAVVTIAKTEGLTAHALSVAVRGGKNS